MPGGFIGDPDVMDTWATSSLTPQIAGRWVDDPDLFERVFPMDLRPQAHDIIRTWLFATVVRSHYEHGSLPWRNAALVGLDPRPRPQEDVEVEGQRQSRRCRPARAVRHRRGALLGGVRAARRRHRVRRGPDEGRPQARDQAAQRVQVRARRSAHRRRDAVADRSARPRHARPARRASSPRRPPRSRPSTTPAPSSAPSRSSGGSATTTSSW